VETDHSSCQRKSGVSGPRAERDRHSGPRVRPCWPPGSAVTTCSMPPVRSVKSGECLSETASKRTPPRRPSRAHANQQLRKAPDVVLSVKRAQGRAQQLMAHRSLFRSPQLESPCFKGDFGPLRRSRKPVWAVPSIEGSNPSLSAPSPLNGSSEPFSHVSMATGGHDRWVSAGQRGSAAIKGVRSCTGGPGRLPQRSGPGDVPDRTDRYGMCPRGSMRVNAGHAVMRVVPSKIREGRRYEMRPPPGLRSWEAHEPDRVSRGSVSILLLFT